MLADPQRALCKWSRCVFGHLHHLCGPVVAWQTWRLHTAGKELAFNREKALPEPGASLDPALLSRLLLCYYASLVSAQDKCPGDFTLPMQSAAQALQLHAVLRSAPVATFNYLCDACITSVRLLACSHCRTCCSKDACAISG